MKKSLEEIYNEVSTRYMERQKALADLEVTIADLSNRLADCSDSGRGEIAGKLKIALSDKAVLQKEIEALNHKRKVSYVAIYEEKLRIAQDEKYNNLKAGTALRLEEDAKEVQKRRAINDREKLVEIERERLMLEAEKNINDLMQDRLDNTVRRCEMELKRAKDEVATW